MLQNLRKAVDDLKERVCSPAPEARLKEIFRKSSGIDPEDDFIREYRRIKKKSNELTHRVSETRMDIHVVRDHHDDAVDVLAMIFLASERLARIERLAKLSAPQKRDLGELRRTMKHALDFDHFASRVISPAWFDMMDPNMLKSPSGDPPWLLGSLAEHLKDVHVDAFVHMLEKNFDRWTSDYAGLGELGFVGGKLGDSGLPWLVKTLRMSKMVRIDRGEKIRLKGNRPGPELIKEIDRMRDSIQYLDNCARRAFLKIKQPNSQFVELAEHLLSFDSTVDNYHKTNKIPAKLVEGMDPASAIHIVEILVRGLRAELERRPHLGISRMDSVNGPDYDRLEGVNSLVASLCRALIKSRDLGEPTIRLIERLDTLPDAVKSRFESWLYLHADDIAIEAVNNCVKKACRSRHPNDEDGLLLDRLKRDDSMADIGDLLPTLLGSTPCEETINMRVPQLGMDKDELRRLHWARTLRHRVELPAAWERCLSTVDGHYKVERDSGGRQAPEASGGQDGATLLDRSGMDDPLEMVRKLPAVNTDVGGFPELTGGRSLVSDLENVVRLNVSKWAEDPAGIIREFRHPEYVAAYFRGLAGTEEDLTPYADRIIHAVKLARTLQWDSGTSSSSTFYRADEHVSVDMAGIKLIEEMVKKDVRLAKDSLADVWSVVSEAVVLPDPETGEQPDYSIEYLYTVDGLPHVRAACALIEVIRYAKRNNTKVPKMALARLTEAVRLTGQYGVDYHACIGPWASFMHAAEPEWFEQNEQYLFGSAASAELGRAALDMYLTGGPPNAFILEKYRKGVLDVVKRDAHMALVRLLSCMLYGMRGYEPEYVAKNLMKNGSEDILKAVGWNMHKLLPEGSSADHVQRGTAFWASALAQSPKPEALAGFGWWADVPGIDQEQWEKLMMRTCELAEKLEWSQRVAERISTSKTITDTGWRILARLIGIDLGYEKSETAKYAMDALRKTMDIADAPESRSHLREVLVEHGFHDALKL